MCFKAIEMTRDQILIILDVFKSDSHDVIVAAWFTGRTSRLLFDFTCGTMRI